MPTLQLHGKYITLVQALKVMGVAGTGGHAKHLVRDGTVTVNGVVETQPGRKLHPGDRVGLADELDLGIAGHDLDAQGIADGAEVAIRRAEQNHLFVGRAGEGEGEFQVLRLSEPRTRSRL